MENIDKATQEKIINLIVALIPDAKIYLFGSRARGTHRQWSDIDLALDAGVILPNVRIGEVSDVLAATNMPYKVDVLDFQNISPEMREIIKKDMQVWKS
jgi:predicted nucleotidyltransferase